MDINLVEETKSDISIQIENIDFSIPDILHHETLKDPNVVFAGVKPPHPILKQFILKIKVNPKLKPLSILIANSEKAVKNTKLILKEAQQAFKEEKK